MYTSCSPRPAVDLAQPNKGQEGIQKQEGYEVQYMGHILTKGSASLYNRLIHIDKGGSRQ